MPEWLTLVVTVAGSAGLGAGLGAALKAILDYRREGQKVVVSTRLATVEADKVTILGQEADTREAGMLLTGYAELIKAMRDRQDRADADARDLKERIATAEARERECRGRLRRLEA